MFITMKWRRNLFVIAALALIYNFIYNLTIQSTENILIHTIIIIFCFRGAYICHKKIDE